MSSISSKFHDAFQNICLSLFVDGYKKMRAEEKYHLDWEENQFSASLCEYIKELKATNSFKIDIIREYHLSNPEFKDGTAKADKANRIDFRLKSWYNSQPIEFHAEAKNLAENNWQKQDGTKVDASALRSRYINTGIDNILTSEYPKNTFLVGYILQGEIDNITVKINSLLKKRQRVTEFLYIYTPIRNYDKLFCSTHTKNRIIHLFLKF